MQESSVQCQGALPNSSNNTSQSSDTTPIVSPPGFSAFDDLIASSELPPPGPDLYLARRELWLTPNQSSPKSPRAKESTGPRKRLEDLLNPPNAIENDKVWKSVEKVWKNLAAGGKPHSNLPLPLAIKIIHGAWLRDPVTWPRAVIAAPQPDDVLAEGVVGVE